MATHDINITIQYQENEKGNRESYRRYNTTKTGSGGETRIDMSCTNGGDTTETFSLPSTGNYVAANPLVYNTLESFVLFADGTCTVRTLNGADATIDTFNLTDSNIVFYHDTQVGATNPLTGDIYKLKVTNNSGATVNVTFIGLTT